MTEVSMRKNNVKKRNDKQTVADSLINNTTRHAQFLSNNKMLGFVVHVKSLIKISIFISHHKILVPKAIELGKSLF